MSLNQKHLAKITSLLAIAVERDTASQSQLCEINFHVKGYAEPGYSDPESGIIATGNWNEVTQGWRSQRQVLCKLPATLSRIFEQRYGVEIEWDDEWTACDDCGKLVRTQPTSYGWQRYYSEGEENHITCGDCIKADPEKKTDYLASLEGYDRKCCFSWIDPAAHGYVKFGGDFENGFYGGQSDDPKKIGAELRARGVNRYLFQIEATGQFDIKFAVYVHQDEIELARQKGELDSQGADPAEGLKAALQSVQLQPAAEGGIQYTQLDTEHGTSKTTTISPEDFIAGNLPK